MTRLRVLAVLPAVAALCCAELVRRGFVYPLLVYGLAPYFAKRGPQPETEADEPG